MIEMFGRHELKLFCIGLGKTGTTTIRAFFEEHGYNVGNQREAEKLIHNYKVRDFKLILKYCKKAQAFQDIPFSLPYTYQALDTYFKNCKFIHTVRNNADEWYKSLVRFHSKRLTDGNRTPVKEDLINDTYLYKGYNWEATKIVFNTPDDDPLNERILKSFYNCHNKQVENYFRYKDNYIKVNVAKDEDYFRLCNFLGLKPKGECFPWENRSK